MIHGEALINDASCVMYEVPTASRAPQIAAMARAR